MDQLVGKTIRKIYISDYYLVFVCENAVVAYAVDGECCSRSYFHDFYGVREIIGRKVISMEEVNIDTSWNKIAGDVDTSVVQVYGYRIECETPNDLFHDSVRGAVVFRNESNGDYGGSMEYVDIDGEKGKIYEVYFTGMKEIIDDWSNECEVDFRWKDHIFKK